MNSSTKLADQVYAETFDDDEQATHYVRAIDSVTGAQVVFGTLDGDLGEIRIVNPDGGSYYVILTTDEIQHIAEMIDRQAAL
ncbi:hypothetical protein SEA_LEONARD_4 [Gordonia phage Leonard]|uniref:Uncharacterized protein n=1 Tax=Gordonia phage Leonard TaxID=2656539 RepID=A0A649VLU1_9CAUD|nr:hypothetical protein BI045_gp04 [Gordonia phage Phinally]YP_010002223.1 hypothetical protein J1769_gp04 [Gordonia phage Leonard]AMS02996.1 hypothetical protein SEA_PHINALLY_4 [Gordonia phage Phinally]QGJ93366.1 hypothetical protein SEA_LEONARD_4 [Gordonia phage Leonard]